MFVKCSTIEIGPNRLPYNLKKAMLIIVNHSIDILASTRLHVGVHFGDTWESPLILRKQLLGNALICRESKFRLRGRLLLPVLLMLVMLHGY
jgi:hypothetical protein